MRSASGASIFNLKIREFENETFITLRFLSANLIILDSIFVNFLIIIQIDYDKLALVLVWLNF